MQVAQDIKARLDAIDREVSSLHERGYDTEVDRLLAERLELTTALDLLWRGLLARS